LSQSERIDELRKCGWSLYRVFPRWKVYARRNKDEYHHYFNGNGLDFVTVFKNGRMAQGHINP